MKKSLLHLARLLGGNWFLPRLNAGVRRVSAFTHRIQFVVQWGIQPNPEWFDHFLDQHYQWTRTRLPFPWERGLFSLLAIKPGARMLELCCGDGFNAHHFYSIRAGSVISVDFDPTAIAHAKRHFGGGNVDYRIADIRTGMPPGKFDNIVWDAAIEHFTEAEITALMADIKGRLEPDGILSGYTIVEREAVSHHEHEYEFKSKEDLMRFLSPHFAHVKVFETVYPTRHNLYFFAGNGQLPFDEQWDQQIVARR
jgi:SAM-dependent methyltransferase